VSGSWIDEAILLPQWKLDRLKSTFSMEALLMRKF